MQKITRILLSVIFTSAILSFSSYSVIAQFPFNVGGTGTGTRIGQGIAKDAVGNVYVTGTYQGKDDFRGTSATPHTLTSPVVSASDGFVAKYNTSGACQWVFNLACNNADCSSVTVDASGNVYVTGYFQGTAEFKGTSALSYILTATDSDCFVAKYDSLGACQWAFNIGGAGDAKGNSITTDGANAYVAGTCGHTFSFQGASGTSHSFTTAGGFVAKYDSSGANQWALLIPGANSIPNGIAADTSGYVYVTGSFTNSPDFDPSANANTLTSAGVNDIFVAKYDGANLVPADATNGGTAVNVPTYQWAFRAGASNNDNGNAITTDGTNVYVTGTFIGTVDFDPSANTFNLKATGISLSDIFVAKYNGTLLPSDTSFFQWAFHLGSGLADNSHGIATDGTNVYVTGDFAGTVDFDPSANTFNLTSIGAYNGTNFVAKYNGTLLPTNTSFLAWAFGIGTAGAGDKANGIAVDGNGNVVVTGQIPGTADFKGTSAKSDTLPSLGAIDCFVAKYNASGGYQWAFNMPSGGICSGNIITRDAVNNVFVAGNLGDAGTIGSICSANFDPAGGTHTPSSILTSTSNIQMFLSKYNASGAYQWVFSMANATANGIASDANGNVYVTGSFTGTVNFQGASGASYILTANGTSVSDIFVAKYNSSGVCQWAFHIGGQDGGGIYADMGHGIVVDASGYVYVTGSFTSTSVGIDFDPSALTNILSPGLSTTTATNVFVAKYDGINLVAADAANGGGGVNVPTCQWAFNIGSTATQTNCIGYGIALDANDNVLVTGSFVGNNVQFQGVSSGTSQTISALGTTDCFVAKYNSSGERQWAFNIGSSAKSAVGYNIALDAGNNVLITGSFAGIDDFKGVSSGTSQNVTALGTTDCFVARYNSLGERQWAFNMGSATMTAIGNGIVTDAGNNVVVKGSFAGTDDFKGTLNVPNTLSSTTGTYFLAKYDSAGAYQWAFNLRNIGGITKDTNSYILSTGSFTGTTNLNPLGTATNLTSVGSQDFYVTKYNSNGTSNCSANTGPNKSFCQGNTTLTLGAAKVNGDTYNWSPAIGLSSTTVSQPLLSPSVTTTYTLTETTTNSGCQAIKSVIVLVFPQPAAPVISASGPTTFCSGGSVILNAGNNYTTYSWSSGASIQNISVDTPGSYSVTVTNAFGCSSASSVTDVTVNPIPATPVISQKGDTLFCSITATTYQWYRNDTLLSGVTSNYYVSPSKGNYTVTIAIAGCSSTSSSFNYTATGINSIDVTDALVVIYPSPAHDYFIAESKTSMLQSVSMYDILGKRILSGEIKDVSTGTDSKKVIINIEALPAGVYLVQLKTNNVVSTLKLVKE